MNFWPFRLARREGGGAPPGDTTDVDPLPPRGGYLYAREPAVQKEAEPLPPRRYGAPPKRREPSLQTETRGTESAAAAPRKRRRGRVDRPFMRYPEPKPEPGTVPPAGAGASAMSSQFAQPAVGERGAQAQASVSASPPSTPYRPEPVADASSTTHDSTDRTAPGASAPQSDGTGRGAGPTPYAMQQAPMRAPSGSVSGEAPARHAEHVERARQTRAPRTEAKFEGPSTLPRSPDASAVQAMPHRAAPATEARPPADEASTPRSASDIADRSPERSAGQAKKSEPPAAPSRDADTSTEQAASRFVERRRADRGLVAEPRKFIYLGIGADRPGQNRAAQPAPAGSREPPAASRDPAGEDPNEPRPHDAARARTSGHDAAYIHEPPGASAIGGGRAPSVARGWSREVDIRIDVPRVPVEDRRPSPSERGRPALLVCLIVLLLGAAGLAAWHFDLTPQRAAGALAALNPRPSAAPPAPPAAVASTASATVAPAIRHPVPASQAKAESELPALDRSDAAMRELVSSLVGAGTFRALVEPQQLVRRIVATVDNLPRRMAPMKMRPFKPAPGPFVPNARNHMRYERYVRAVEAIDAAALVRQYARFYPLFQRAYEDLGFPGRYFNDRLIDVIDHLLLSPELTGPVELIRPRVLYQYADLKLEARSAGQKFMMRMGPEHARRVKAKLREIRAEVVALGIGAHGTAVSAPPAKPVIGGRGETDTGEAWGVTRWGKDDRR